MAIDVSYDLRTAVYDRLQRLDFATHDRMDTGQVVSRASSDVGMMLAILSIVPILLGNVVLLVAVADRDDGPVARADAGRPADRARCCS